MTINLADRKINVAGKNGSRKRRYSVDNARKEWYAQHRRNRFAKRLGF